MDEVLEAGASLQAVEETGQISKFKSGPELLRAYQNLERRFTQKCQELSEVKKAQQDLDARDIFSAELKLEDAGTDNTDTEAPDSETAVTDTAQSPANTSAQTAADEEIPDKPGINNTIDDMTIGQDDAAAGNKEVSPADAIKADAEKLISFFPDAANYIESIGEALIREGSADFTGMIRAYTEARIQSGIQALKDDKEFLDSFYTSDEFQKRYIEDIKKSIRHSPPIMREKGSYTVTPPEMPKNLEEAGKLAIAMLSRK